MGTNYYAVKKEPTIRESVHLCKRSFGWKTSWQATDENEVGRWCDRDPSIDDEGRHVDELHSLPHSIHSVDDIRSLMRTGEWLLVDEYGAVYDDWESKIDDLESRSYEGDFEPRDHVAECGGGFHDSKGNVFLREGFE